MPELPHTPYHIQEHTSSVLLRPIAAELAILEARLNTYVQRLRMKDADRATVAEAQQRIAAAQADVASLARR